MGVLPSRRPTTMALGPIFRSVSFADAIETPSKALAGTERRSLVASHELAPPGQVKVSIKGGAVMHRLAQSLAAVVAISVMMVGAGALVPIPALAQRPDVVVIGTAQEPDNLIGAFSSMTASSIVLSSMFAEMVQRDDQGKLFPRLVEKIPSLKDGNWEVLPGKKMKVTYRIRKGYTWHDGRPVTALDASWTYLMLRNPRTPTVSRFVLRKIENMLVPDPNDPYTLVVQWNELYSFANTGHSVYPQHVLEREYLRDPAGLKAHQQARAPIGNGPYRFVEWVPGSHIILEAYDKFPEGRAKIRRQVWRFILDSTVLQANVIAGQVDVAVNASFSIEQMMVVDQRAPQVKVHFLPAMGWEHIDFNLDNEWLKDKHVRQALIHAINREEINQRLFYGRSAVSHSWLPPGHEGHNPNITKYAYDPSRARQLLAEAGFVPGPDGILRDRSGKRLELTIMTTAGHATREQVQQIIREHFKAVGINLRIDNRPASVLFGQVTRQRQFAHLVMYNWNFSPLTLGPPLWHSSQIPTAANNWEGQNTPGWRHAENDRLLDQIAEELDVTKRIQLLRRQQEVWAEEVPAIPLFHGLSLTTSKKALNNVLPGVLGGILFAPEHWEWAQ